VPLPRLGVLPGARQELPRVLPDDRQHRQARLPVRPGLAPEEARVHQRREPAEDVEPLPRLHAHRLCGPDRAAALEDGHAPEDGPIAFAE
jgi:hypothetical protein